MKMVDKKESPNGFFTLSNSLGELWDNKKDDGWDKYLNKNEND